jgi:hypothetical protein
VGKAAEDAKHTTATEESTNNDSSSGIWWAVGVFLVAGIGIGFLLISRRNKQPGQQP